MLDVLHTVSRALAETTDGARGWAQFVNSVGDAIEGNQALLPVVGGAIAIIVVLVVVSLANVRLAHTLERVWRRRHPDTDREH